MIRPTLLIKLLIFLTLFLNLKLMAYEEANYVIMYQNDIYEIRKYNDRLAIQVNYTNESSGFRKLFNYISGSNINSSKISMTTPVTQSIKEGVNVMEFYLPSSFTKKNAPLPTNKEIKLVTIDKGYYAVIKFSGRSTDKNFAKYKKILKANLLKNNIKILGLPIKATYNAPFTLPILKRNEIMFRVTWKK